MALIDRKASSLNTLKRLDPDIDESLATAGHVCLYSMPPDNGKWERKNVEGPLFLVKRRTQPRFQLIVLNKMSAAEHYVETLTGDMETETNAPYIMYTHGDDMIHGIWFSEESDLLSVLGPLERILAQLPKQGYGGGVDALIRPPPPAQVAPPAPQQQPKRQQAPPPSRAPQAAESSGQEAGGDDAFWDKSVRVTEGQLPPTQQLAGFSLGAQDPQPPAPAAGGGFQHMLRQAQQRATVTPPAPQPANGAAPAAPAAAKAPAAPLLTPGLIQQAAAQQPPPGPPEPPASGGNPLQQLLSRAAKPAMPEPPAPIQTQLRPPAPSQPVAAPAPPQPPPGPALSPLHGPAPVPMMPPPPLHLQPAPQHVRQALRQAFTRALASDVFVDVLAMELHQAGVLKL